MAAHHPSTVRSWIEAMRLRTLPVSVSGVVFAAGLSVCADTVSTGVLSLCMAFAVLAQIASNFANEYYDYRDGLDRAGRIGPRRGVTEGDITPRAMKLAAFLTLGAACAIGLILVALYGSWWMYAAGVAIALGAMAYSAGPWPLSRHGLGEVAVICFFGVAPVSLTYLLSGGAWSWYILALSIAIGLQGANVLMVNNYRDYHDDKAVGKLTLCVMTGRRSAANIYLANGIIAAVITLPAWLWTGSYSWIAPCVYAMLHTSLYRKLSTLQGKELNPLLGMTAMLMLIFSLTFLILSIISQ